MSQMHHPCHQFLHRNRTSNRDCRVVQESEFLVREAPASLEMARQDTSHVVCYFYLYHPDWSYKNNSLYNDPFLPSIPLGHRMEDFCFLLLQRRSPSTHVLQHMWGAKALSWSPSFTPK